MSQKAGSRHRNGASGRRSVGHHVDDADAPASSELSVSECCDTTLGCRDYISVLFGEAPYEILVWLRRAVSRRYLGNRLAVQHIRHGMVSTHTELFASRRFRRSAEGKTDCCAATGANDRENPPPGTRLSNRSNGVVRAGFTVGEARQAGEGSPQLQRWLRNKFQGRQRSLDWM